MQIKLKTMVFIVSLIFNGLIIITLVITAASKLNVASLSFPAVEDGYTAAAAVVVAPASSNLVFIPVESTLNPGEKIFLQYAVVTAANKQINIGINALYDPQIVAIEYTGSGIAITALREGETLLQYIANDGIKNLIRITVTKK